ncbi:hypothetical protein ACWAUP_001982 [Pseudomonas aeruginosa]
MNREDVAIDVTIQDVEILRNRVAELETVAQQVGDLLAVIHRDGGHYQDEHGIAKAIIDAKEVVNQDRIDLNEWQHAAETADSGAKKLADYAVQLEGKIASKHPEQAGGDERAADEKPRATRCPDCGEHDLMPGDICACGYETDPATGYACSECDGSGEGCVGEVCRECDGSGWFVTPDQARAALAHRAPEVCSECSDTGKVYDESGDGPWSCYACTGNPEVIGYANGDELDNMLDDRTAVLSPGKTSFHTVPVYRLIRAALARVAELEKQEPVATVAKVPGEDWNSLDFHRDMQDMQPGTKLYAAPVAQAQQLNDLDKQCRDDVARALGLRPNQERGFAWSYLLASIKSCVKASGDSAQAQHSVPEEFSFEYRHPNGESHTVTVSRDQVINEMPDFLFEALCSKFCNCEPAGETNVVECCCDEYAEEFKLLAAAPGKEGV